MQIIYQITNQADSIGVVAVDIAICLQHQRIHRAGNLGPRRQAVAQLPGFAFERGGDIDATKPLLLQFRDTTGEVVDGQFNSLVTDRFSGLARKRTVDFR